MKRTIHKTFWMWNFDKEEQWLNQMSASGWQLCSVGLFRYVFEEGAPGEYVYRLELLDNWSTHFESQNYIRFVEDTGAEQVGLLMRWVYFRKKADGDGFDLFSDIASRIKHLSRMETMAGILAAVNLSNTVIQSNLAFSQGGHTANLLAAAMCAFAGLLCGYGFIRIWMKKSKLKKERRLHE